MTDENFVEPAPAEPEKPREHNLHYWVVIGCGILLVFIIGGYIVWNNAYSSEAMRARQERERVQRYNQFVSVYEAAMKADTYGGKTPQETLDMFIDALGKGDFVLASKYFALETNEKDPNYLTRKKWEDAIEQVRNQGKIAQTIEILLRALPELADQAYESDFKFVSRSIDGRLEAYINLELNKYSNVWKIESM